jgi:hypothetical protein
MTTPKLLFMTLLIGVTMNQSQNSLPENPHQGDHEAGDGPKGNVGFSVAVIPGDQSPPVV